MARISLPAGDTDELYRLFRQAPHVSEAAAALSWAVYEQATLPVRLRELMRARIAEINHCTICAATRPAEMAANGLDEEAYAHLREWASWPGYTDAERIAIEYAEKFLLDHLALDDAFFDRLRAHFSDEQIMEITVSVGTWMMMGRITAIMDVSVSCPVVLSLTGPDTTASVPV